jgi:predicted transcriptional regulator
MSRDIAVVAPDESMHHVYFKMKQSYIQYMPVMDKNGFLIGLITGQELNRPIPSKAKVSDYMCTPVGQASSDTPLLEIAKRIQELKLSAVAIMEKKQVVGVIAASDLLKVLVPLMSSGSKELEPLPSRPAARTSSFISGFFHASN